VVVITRRGLLAAAAVALAGCGRAAKPTPMSTVDAGTQREGDVEVLGFLLAYERQGVALYARGGDPLLATLLERERGHVAQLERALRALGGPQPAPLPLPPGRGLALARRVEDTALAAYLDAIPKLADPALRALCARIVTDEAEHLAAVRLRLGEPAAPEPFVTGAKQL
jgi:rubrerythrin